MSKFSERRAAQRQKAAQVAVPFTTRLMGWIGENPDMRLTRWVFLRALGIVYLIAFASYTVQAKGLIGENGILPMNLYLDPAVGNFLILPTLFWFSTSNALIMAVCIAGIILSLLFTIGVAQRWILPVLYLLYISLINGAPVFVYQWDTLLLEAGILAIFLTPPQIRPLPASEEQPPLMIVIYLFRWLLFRLMFGSGALKLLGGDLVWTNLTAMSYHYETQPMPNPISWYMYHLPMWMDQIQAGVTLFIEVLIPFMYFTPRRLRFIGAALTALLQVLIMITGNFGFFNLLTLALCLTLFDDQAIRKVVPQAWSWLRDRQVEWRVSPIWRGVAYTAGTVLLILSLVIFPAGLRLIPFLPEAVFTGLRTLQPYHLVNTYGLFADMTTQRFEVVVEGSSDGENWEAYEFHYKVTDPTRAPVFAAPHMPRLDWQMWFAALGDPQREFWFTNFMFRLLQGEPDVVGLLKHNPFPDEPPILIRARLYDYNYTTFEQRRELGQWWAREDLGEYFPEMALP